MDQPDPGSPIITLPVVVVFVILYFTGLLEDMAVP
jgi:hypothetical protein